MGVDISRDVAKGEEVELGYGIRFSREAQAARLKAGAAFANCREAQLSLGPLAGLSVE